MTLRIEQGKGRRRHRYAMLLRPVLPRAPGRVWWRVAPRRRAACSRADGCFPGLDPVDPLSTRQLKPAPSMLPQNRHTIGKRVSIAYACAIVSRLTCSKQKEDNPA